MAINVNQLRSGGKVMLDGSPCMVVENEHVKPGKGPAFNRMKVRNLKTGRIIAKTFPSSANLEEADVMERSMRLLYIDQSGWHFMDEVSYDQHTLTEAEVSDQKRWLKDGVMVNIIMWEGRPISLVVDNFVELKVIECAESAKGDTVSGGTKPAVVETGCEIKVPLFIKEGEVIKIDTRTGEYVSRA